MSEKSAFRKRFQMRFSVSERTLQRKIKMKLKLCEQKSLAEMYPVPQKVKYY